MISSSVRIALCSYSLPIVKYSKSTSRTSFGSYRLRPSKMLVCLARRHLMRPETILPVLSIAYRSPQDNPFSSTTRIRMVPEFLQVWIQLMKASARSSEQNCRDGLDRVKWSLSRLHRAQHERILVEIYRFRMQEIVDKPRADRVALAEVLYAKPVWDNWRRSHFLEVGCLMVYDGTSPPPLSPELPIPWDSARAYRMPNS